LASIVSILASRRSSFGFDPGKAPIKGAGDLFEYRDAGDVIVWWYR
jgi:hypothetical protein